MKEITREEFKNELAALHEAGTKFDVNSIDGGSIFFSMKECCITADENEIALFKPHTLMEVDIDFDIIDTIYKEETTYTLEFNNGMSDVEISAVE